MRRSRLALANSKLPVMRLPLRSILVLALTALAAPALAQGKDPVDLRILAINDFHGNLKPPQAASASDDPADSTKTINVPAGGAEQLATLVEGAREEPNHIFVAAGDLIGATPLLSALFHDEPTIEALGAMGLEVSSVGNHEFDKGATELLRMQGGGCNPVDGCKGPQPFAGASFRYLAASTVTSAPARRCFRRTTSRASRASRSPSSASR